MKEEILFRTKQIGLDVIKLINELPSNPASWVITKQIVRSATSVGANYRAACRAKSTADFIYKLKIVEEETDETNYWIEILVESDLTSEKRVENLKNELNELLSIFVSSINTLKNKTKK
jgi:four helix bundle protein